MNGLNREPMGSDLGPGTAATRVDPGFVAISEEASGAWSGDVGKIAVRLGATRPVVVQRGELQIATWGLGEDGDSSTHRLTAGPRRGERDVTDADLERMLSGRDDQALAEMLPPFGVLGEQTDGSLRAATDLLGFRHLYHCGGQGWSGVSSSARALALGGDAGLDRQGLAVQSLLGWQLGTRTIFSGVEKLPAGHVITLERGRRTLRKYAEETVPSGLSLDEAAVAAAGMLRDYLEALIDDHPDTVLQLTGGQDSRILLSAIHPKRRAGLTAMTLAVPGSPDAAIAGALTARSGMKHRVVSLTGLEEIPAEAAYQACLEAARRIEGMSDPIAFAALVIAEAGHSHERRLSGLGGEVARGFYYFGSMTPAPVTMARTARLAEWRMFANESVGREALVPEFSQWAKEFTVEEIFRILSGSGLDWIPATDEFYLAERMQRWAGVVDTAICFDRVVVNPMLDRRFLQIARGLDPADKSGSRFLGRLQVELDPELARIPLDGRPAPYVFADPDALNRARITATAGRKALRKVGQRLARSRRAPAGGDILAGKIVQHWQAFPQTLDPIRELDVYQGKWLDDVLAGEVRPAPSSVALLVNLLAATG